LLRDIWWRRPAMPRRQKCEHFIWTQSPLLFSSCPSIQNSGTSVGARFEFGKATRTQHVGQSCAGGIVQFRAMDRTAKPPGQRRRLPVHIARTEWAVMLVLPRNHHARRRHHIPECHGLRSLGRKPGSGRNQSPLPCRKTPFQIVHVATGQAKLGDKLRHCQRIECRHS
jgi:hypothetical protein